MSKCTELTLKNGGAGGGRGFQLQQRRCTDLSPKRWRRVEASPHARGVGPSSTSAASAPFGKSRAIVPGAPASTASRSPRTCVVNHSTAGVCFRLDPGPAATAKQSCEASPARNLPQFGRCLGSTGRAAHHMALLGRGLPRTSPDEGTGGFGQGTPHTCCRWCCSDTCDQSKRRRKTGHDDPAVSVSARPCHQ